MKISGNKILITGGATGIGLGLAERFLDNKNAVIVCGRRQAVLKEAKEKYPSLITTVCDLCDSAHRKELFEWIAAEHPDLNVLINNAGIQNWMSLDDDGFLERAKEEIAINVEAPIHLSHLFVGLRSLDTIINVTSGLAFSPLAKTPVYSGTKAFLRSFTLSLRYSLRSRNIEVIELVPPALNTDLGGKGIHDSFPPVKGFIDSVFEQLQQGKTTITYGTSEAAANSGPDVLQKIFERLNPA